MTEQEWREARDKARKAIETALVGPTTGGLARMLAPVVMQAIIADQIPGVSFAPKGGRND